MAGGKEKTRTQPVAGGAAAQSPLTGSAAAGAGRKALLSPEPPASRVTPVSRVTLIVPVYNEQESISLFLQRINALPALLPADLQLSVLFVNDGSQDATERRILAAREAAKPGDPDIALVSLSRNFGKEAALFAGLQQAAGDALIPLDVDLQDPPELIPRMITRWREGAKIVNARRALRDEDSWFKRHTAGIFYRIFNAMAEHPIPRDVGDFRLLDREVVTAVNRMGERARFNKALFSWVGFETAEVCYERPARAAGSSRWSVWKLSKLALDGIFTSSTAPLRIWTWIGLCLSALSLLYSAWLLIRTLLFGVDVPGYASTAIMILTFGGMNLFALGIIGEYIGRIYTEVRQRPLYLIRARYGLDQPG